jgi:hypothetical protein
MAIRLKLKNSVVANKAPLPTDLEIGEVAINANAASPAAYIKDSAGAIVKLAGAGAIGGTPATESAAGIVELATAAETTTGADATRAVHPAGLKVELDKKAPLASPALTGTPTAPTAAAGTNTTQLATTAFVTAAVTAEDLWDRTGTEISPKTAGDSVFTSGAVKVGGTTAAPNVLIQAAGKLGVGAPAPAALIHVNGRAANAGLDALILRNSGDGANATANLYLTANSAGTGVERSAVIKGINAAGDTGTDLGFFTNPSAASPVERYRVTSTGDFLLGGTLPASPNITLRADGRGFFGPGARSFAGTLNADAFGDSDCLAAWAGGNSYKGRIAHFYTNTTSSNAYKFIYCANSTREEFSVYGNGNVVYAGTLTPPSDATLKEAIVDADLDNQWDDIKRIQLRKYQWKGEPERGTMLGVIAQELETVSPGLIVKDTDDDGNVVEGSCKVKVDALYMKMLGALQVAQQRIEALETRLAALEPAAPHKQADPGAK